MTDYNDGEWHNYGGQVLEAIRGESLVTFVWHDEETGHCGVEHDTPARKVAWHQVLKFRVTEPSTEPRVLWVNEYADGKYRVHSSKREALVKSMSYATRVAVRYVETPE